MKRYSQEIKEEILLLRSRGKTYGEIRAIINLNIPKSTLSDLCRDVKLPAGYKTRIFKLNLINLTKGRQIANEINKIKREELFTGLKKINLPIAERIEDREIAKIALAILCLGEASKYNPKTRTAFYLGNSDPRIIKLFLQLLKKCYEYDQNKVRCTVQCRADQDTDILQKYWIGITEIPANFFYKPRIDPRTIGKPTLNKSYKGVLRINYFDTKIQHDLESLADLICNTVKGS